LEKTSKKVAKGKAKANSTNQIDMFAMGNAPTPTPSNDIDVEALKSQLDEAISSVETLLKESA